MKIEKLDEYIKCLATSEPSEALFINCYLDVNGAPLGYRKVLDERVNLLRRSLADKELANFDEAFARIEAFLLTEVSVLTRGVALLRAVASTRSSSHFNSRCPCRTGLPWTSHPTSTIWLNSGTTMTVM